MKAVLSNGGSSRVTFLPSLTWMKSRFLTPKPEAHQHAANEQPQVSLWSPIATQRASECASKVTFCRWNRRRGGAAARGRSSGLLSFQGPKLGLIFSDFSWGRFWFPAWVPSQLCLPVPVDGWFSTCCWYNGGFSRLPDHRDSQRDADV